MAKNRKDKSGLWQYLDALGLLSNGTAQEIAAAKEVFWKNYRSDQRKERRRQQKTFEVFFTPNEAHHIARFAKIQKLSSTQFIKQSALAKSNEFISPVIIGEIRQLLKLFEHQILEVAESEPNELMNSLLYKFEKVQIGILNFLQPNNTS